MRNNEIRFVREHPVEDTTTTIQVNPVRLDHNVRAVEVLIEQAVYKKFDRRHAPRRLYSFVLTEEYRKALVDLLNECAP